MIAMDAEKTVRIKWIKSANGAKEPQKRTIKALGFRRLQSEVVHKASPQILGMVNAVRHLVKVMEISE
jgi:large subunit ribosomal protein L30